MSDTPLRIYSDRDGKLLRLRLNMPKANIVDAAMIAALDAAFAKAASDTRLRAVLLEHEGPNFSFGASVPEHMPDQCAAMLKSLHALVIRMIDFPVPILVAIKGQCLGGGLEVAMGGHLLFAAPEAKLGQPEIQLAVFAPAASCLLPERMFRPVAEDMLYSGRSSALSMRLPPIRKPLPLNILTNTWPSTALLRCVSRSRRRVSTWSSALNRRSPKSKNFTCPVSWLPMTPSKA
jgi:cyclohexa-1,5-dienecarbonyl-CoA hydratase